jgi:hypothetical protein
MVRIVDRDLRVGVESAQPSREEAHRMGAIARRLTAMRERRMRRERDPVADKLERAEKKAEAERRRREYQRDDHQHVSRR